MTYRFWCITLRKWLPAIFFIFGTQVFAAPGTSPSTEFMMNEVRHWYMEGEFAKAIGILQKHLSANAKLDRQDSIFIYKHLGVMYSAEYETREKGKWAFHKLLLVDTAAKITDMYASDMIYAIFRTVSEEAEASRLENRVSKPSGLVGKQPETDTAKEPGQKPIAMQEKRRIGFPYFWVGATTVIALGAGVTGYFVLAEKDFIPGEDYPIE